VTTATINDVPADTINSTADLLLGISNRDPASWDEILRRYGQLVWATARSLRLQEADALDAVQMTWLRLAENAHRIQFPERLGGWLKTTARRECLRILRQARSATEITDVGTAILADPTIGPEQRVIDADTARMLWELVEELPPRRRAVLRALFSDQPRPYAELSRLTGIPAGGIGPTRARALRALRDKLEEGQAMPAVAAAS
jgi:RNA polymerase sigma factor (sigma-70 family)